jgi:hypothetical protein
MFYNPQGGMMSKKSWIFSTGVMLFILLCFTLSWADSGAVQIKCLPEQPSELTVPGDEIQSKAGVHRNQVLLEIFTATS